LYTIIECDDAEFADIVGTAYNPTLSFLEDTTVTWGHYWQEPYADNDGYYHPQDVREALRSFIFYEAAPAVGPRGRTASEQTKAAWYTPLKRFTFDERAVTCNMPFYKWGEGADEHMVKDKGGCDPLINNNRDASGPFEGQGPPGCDDEDLAQFRGAGGQVLGANTEIRSGASLLPLDVTVKLHRAVRHNDGVYPYYAIFDASTADFAGWFGVPQSARLGDSVPAKLHHAVTLVNVFLNGIACDDCNPWGFQDPVAPALLDTPIHQFTYYYLDCDVTFPTRPVDFTSDAGRECPLALVNAQALGVIESNTTVFYGEIERMIDDRRAYQASSTTIVNSPFVAQLTLRWDDSN